MAYCRFSDEDGRCDVYAYASVYGTWVINIAQERYVPNIALPPPVLLPARGYDHGLYKAWYERHRAVLQILQNSPTVPIDLPYAGQTWYADTAGICLSLLVELRHVGYNIPQCAIDDLIEEEMMTGADEV